MAILKSLGFLNISQCLNLYIQIMTVDEDQMVSSVVEFYILKHKNKMH